MVGIVAAPGTAVTVVDGWKTGSIWTIGWMVMTGCGSAGLTRICGVTWITGSTVVGAGVTTLGATVIVGVTVVGAGVTTGVGAGVGVGVGVGGDDGRGGGPGDRPRPPVGLEQFEVELPDPAVLVEVGGFLEVRLTARRAEGGAEGVEIDLIDVLIAVDVARQVGRRDELASPSERDDVDAKARRQFRRRGIAGDERVAADPEPVRVPAAGEGQARDLRLDRRTGPRLDVDRHQD